MVHQRLLKIDQYKLDFGQHRALALKTYTRGYKYFFDSDSQAKYNAKAAILF